MIIDLNKYKYFALFLNNENPQGFKPSFITSNFYSTEIDEKKEGYFVLRYDLKNKIEQLNSTYKSKFDYSDTLFFEAEICINDEIELGKILNLIPNFEGSALKLSQKISKADYISVVNQLKNEIQAGNIYEVNYCIGFEAHDVEINPYSFFKSYNKKVAAPMSVLLKIDEFFILSCSPERFLKKSKNKLVSQPIKGTAKRGKTITEDQQIILQMLKDEKELSENIMIVDLVRNDLSRIAEKGSVTVDELCKIYTFKNVHQSISSVSCKLKEGITFNQIIDATFPMGSMTGAPKVSAMKIIDKVESQNREFFSGSIGQIYENGEFDSNVIIRTVFYDRKNKKLSFNVGSAITALCNAEKEYEECMLKVQAVFETLNLKMNNVF